MNHDPTPECWCNPTPTHCKEGIVWVHHEPQTTFNVIDYSDGDPRKMQVIEGAASLLGGKIESGEVA